MAKALNSTLLRAAARIESDIRSRQLGSGDRYLTADEAAELLGFSSATCHRAMKLLAERNILSRRRNSGTFVSEGMDSQPVSQVRSVYVLLSADRRLGVLPQGEVMSGLWRELPGVDLHFTILPKGNEVRYLEDLLGAAELAGQLMGVVAISCLREVYEYLARQSAPVVVVGSVDSVGDNLTTVDGDQQLGGRLLANCVLAKGYRQIAVLMPELWRRGDNLFLAGIQEAMHDAQLSVGALSVHSVPTYSRSVQQQVMALLSEVSEPRALICKEATSFPWIEELKRGEPDLNWQNVGIAFLSDTELLGTQFTYPYVALTLPAIELFAIAGKMLAQLSSGAELPQRHVLLPMTLHEPPSQ